MSTKVLFWDNTVSYSTSSQYLIKEGYEVEMAPNPDAGLRQLNAQDYDIIIIQETPDAESWQICEEIRRLSGMPLIVISTNASTDTCVKAIMAGADYFLRKPFGPLELIARVKSLLQRTYLNQPAHVGA
jgi:two-component system response regulator ResD